MVKDGSLAAVLCQFNADRVRCFDCATHTIETLPNTYQDAELEIGAFYFFKHAKLSKRECKRFEGNIEFSNSNGNATARTWAISPKKEDLSKEIFEKYEGKVWNPFLGLLHDPEQKFSKVYENGGEGSVVARFAPSEMGVFEIVNVDKLSHSSRHDFAPWNLEVAGLPTVEPEPHPSKLVFPYRNESTCKGNFIRHAICVKTNIRNVAYSPRSGSFQERCNLFFCLKFGATRSFEGELGGWYQHQINDTRGTRVRTGTYMHSANVSGIAEVEPPLATEVIGNTVFITTDFLFNHSDYEDKTKCKTVAADSLQWNARCSGCKSAHFWNNYLGKVEINRINMENILEMVKTLKESSPNESGLIKITVLTSFDNDSNLNSYPEKGLFKVRDVLSVDWQ